MRLHVTGLGIFAVVLLAVERFPSPALKPKPPLFARHTADTADTADKTARALIPSAAD